MTIKSKYDNYHIIWTKAGLLSTGPLGTKFSEISMKIQNFSFMKMHLKISSAKRRPVCPGGNKLIEFHGFTIICLFVVATTVIIGSSFMGCIWLCYSGLIHWCWTNRIIVSMPVKQPWRIWVKLTTGSQNKGTVYLIYKVHTRLGLWGSQYTLTCNG